MHLKQFALDMRSPTLYNSCTGSRYARFLRTEERKATQKRVAQRSRVGVPRLEFITRRAQVRILPLLPG